MRSRGHRGPQRGQGEPTTQCQRPQRVAPSLTTQRGTCLASELSSQHQTLSWVAGCETLTSGVSDLLLFGSKSKPLPGSTKGGPPEEAVSPRVWGG